MKSIQQLFLVCAALGLAACGSQIDTSSPEFELEFSDANFELCVRTSLGLPDETITKADIANVYALECQDASIRVLDGLEHFENLKELSLWENFISDVGPLNMLVNLEYLELGANDIFDISALNGLRNLKRVGLYGNSLTTIAHLGSSRALEWLNIDDNQIADLSALTGMPALKWVTLEGNPISTPHIISTLRQNSVEVFDGTEVPSSKSRLNPADHLSPTRAGGKLSTNHRFTWQIDRGDRVSFVCEVSGEVQDVQQEYAGDITLEGDSFVYRRDSIEVVIGRGTADGWNFCDGEYAQTCQLSFAVMDAAVSTARASTVGDAKPVCSVALSLAPQSSAFFTNSTVPSPSFDKDLVPYVLASPNQFDAGTCLFMSNTGAMEILLNQRANMSQVDYLGDTDLSERYLMNASNHVPRAELDYSITDVMETYNYFGGSLLSREYPFTAGYMVEEGNGTRPATANEEGAYFTCSLNWVDQLPSDWQNIVTTTPKTDRTMIAIDPNLNSNSIWNVGLFNDEVIERVKYELRVRNSPVIIIYNHYLYWHADIIVGYDDNASIGECPMVKSTLSHFEENGNGGYVSRVENHMAREGGCSDKGVFYVRDSIYEGTEQEPMYSYSDEYDFTERYSQRIIERSYDWVKYLSNHAYVVHRK